ncbi:hypothetical protein AB0I60_26435 [Actinosynnema sp. NPDC050436]|uniref:hypothetical protein n=1 Tax=Actinosynnema sp. NPDC050436 TaxID=3155659 RepID=UPI003403995A
MILARKKCAQAGMCRIPVLCSRLCEWLRRNPRMVCEVDITGRNGRFAGGSPQIPVNDSSEWLSRSRGADPIFAVAAALAPAARRQNA